MGTLDDAIREHLELKRKQGASSEELERQESEALGHRSPAPEPPPAATEPAFEEAAVPEPEPPAAPEAEVEFAEEPALPAADPGLARNGASASDPAEDSADLFDQDLIDSSATAPDEPVVRRARPEPEPEEPEDEEAEDFLEDTPEFLEETPEHDRLWFEQKPPKDFDFD